MMFVWWVVAMLDRTPVLFILFKTYGGGVSCSCPNPNRGILRVFDPPKACTILRIKNTSTTPRRQIAGSPDII
jgi:hypothetical protein